jgi:CBS domain-containing protein
MNDDVLLKGILSERDVVRGLADHGAEALKFPVTELMSSPVRRIAASMC